MRTMLYIHFYTECKQAFKKHEPRRLPRNYVLVLDHVWELGNKGDIKYGNEIICFYFSPILFKILLLNFLTKKNNALDISRPELISNTYIRTISLTLNSVSRVAMRVNTVIFYF